MTRTTIATALLALMMAVPGTAAAQDGGDIVPRLARLADGGSAEAAYHLGMAYHLGNGVPRDEAKALAAFRRAAEGGDPLGAYKLGCFYDGQGEGVAPPDAAAALRWKRVAAEAGYALAQQDVAALEMRAGRPREALAWLARSAAQGWSGGLLELANAYNGLNGVPKVPERTAAYFRLYLSLVRPSDVQVDWLLAFEKTLTPAQRAAAEAIVRDYRPAPTPLTIKGLAGARARDALLAAGR